ncbi:MAG: TonB-dependent receptor [Acidobacteria bacterium]|nr:TonB-dependent receptor [Acidobacteriota bacterium]
MYTLRFCMVIAICTLIFARSYSIDDLDNLTVEGTITDTAGAALPGAQITALRAATGFRRVAASLADGRYRISSLPPGAYSLSVDAPGFNSATSPEVTGSAGATIRRDFQLTLSAVTEQIIIKDTSGDSSLVDPTRTVVGSTLDITEIDALPVESRNPLDLLFILAGAAPPALYTDDLAEGESQFEYRRTPEESGVFSLNGGTPFSNNITIEGMDNNDDRAARERFIPSPDSVEEIQVISNQFSAEYGRASGGRVNLRLRSGANNYRGRLYHYFRDARLNANSFHRNSDPTRSFKLPFTQINPGVSIGGPVIRNWVFFFSSVEHDRISDSADIQALVPVSSNPFFPIVLPNVSGGGANLGHTGIDRQGRTLIVNGGADVGFYDLAVSTPRNATRIQNRADFNIGRRHRALIVMTQARQRDERAFPGRRRLLETLRASGRDSTAVSGSNTLVISPRSISQTRIQWSRLIPHDAPQTDRPVVLIEIDDPRDRPGDSTTNLFSRTGTLVAGASTTSAVLRRESRFQIQQTLERQQSFISLRTGFDVQRVKSSYRDLADATGVYSFSSPADFLDARPARYRHRFNTSSSLENTYLGMFLQADWKAHPSLLIAAGLRWDTETAVKDRNNVGPRLALAWNPGRSKRQVFRAGYGMFFNRALLRTLDDFVLTSSSLLVDTNLPAAATLLNELRFPEVLRQEDPRVVGSGVREDSFLRRLEPGFRLPESVQASAGYEREIAPRMKVEINYVFNRGAHLWREVNVNAPRLPEGFKDFSEYLLSQDFDNRTDPATGVRPITTTGNADFVRFETTAVTSRTITEAGRRIVVFGIAQPSTSNATSARRAALAVVRRFRPDPGLEQVEELQARGNSYYHGLTVTVSGKFARVGFIRAGYTLSRTVDDGVVNTSSPLVPGDFIRERAPSLLDARHRVTIAGQVTMPGILGRAVVAGALVLHSSQPFNIGIGGNDRNLDDVNNDRPNYYGKLSDIRWRSPDAALDNVMAASFELPLLGSIGNLPRNAGRGPWGHSLNLRLSRIFRYGEKLRLTPQIEAFNPLNATVFRFGAEFVDYTPNSLGDFLVPRRTIRPRTVRLGLRFDF